MQRTHLLALAGAAALAMTPAAFGAKPKAASTPPDDAVAPAALTADTTAPTPLTALKPAQLPAHVPVVATDQTALGQVAKVYVDASGNVSSVLIAPSGQSTGKKVPAAQITLSGGNLVLAMDKAAFDALPATS